MLFCFSWEGNHVRALLENWFTRQSRTSIDPLELKEEPQIFDSDSGSAPETHFYCLYSYSK